MHFFKIYVVFFLTVVKTLLFNILIAMMDHTQEETNHRPREWIRQVKFDFVYSLWSNILKEKFCSGDAKFWARNKT